MGRRNGTAVTEFILVGFPAVPQLQILLFTLFLAVYIFTIVANAAIISAVKLEPRLHKPMYFFISNFSFLEMWYTTAFIPKMMADLMTGHNTISVQSCITQFYFLFLLAATENFLLALMSYDRYVAICNPLRYATILTNRVCVQLSISCWMAGILAPLMPAVWMSSLYFCGPNEIDHFYCDFAPLLTLSCTDASLSELSFYILAWCVIWSCFLFTMVSYIYIISTILGITSTTGRMKAFSTCVSHLAVVSIYYGAVIFMYIRPTATARFHLDKVVSVFYSFVTPVLNPIIYSLRNKEVKEALRRAVDRSRRRDSVMMRKR